MNVNNAKSIAPSLQKYLAITLVIVGLVLVGKATYIHAKAQLAQILIAQAYTKQTYNQQAHKPWPWADTHVVAKLTIKNETHFILAGASGRNLAFGPSHIKSTATPGSLGNSVIVGHRDTHFKHLQNVVLGETIIIEKGGSEIHYTVTEIALVHESKTEVLAPVQHTALTLITCYPFNNVSPNPNQRWVIRAVKIS